MTAGKPVIDWDDEAACKALVDSRARDGYALLHVLEQHGQLSEPVGQAAQLLATVLGQDIEADEGGGLRIARKVAPTESYPLWIPKPGTATRPRWRV